MVMTVMLAQGLSEKGGEKWLKRNELVGRMLNKVASSALERGLPLVFLYCGDGADGEWEDGIEIKCATRIISEICPDLMIELCPFSFHDSDASQKLDDADVFLFQRVRW